MGQDRFYRLHYITNTPCYSLSSPCPQALNSLTTCCIHLSIGQVTRTRFLASIAHIYKLASIGRQKTRPQHWSMNGCFKCSGSLSWQMMAHYLCGFKTVQHPCTASTSNRAQSCVSPIALACRKNDIASCICSECRSWMGRHTSMH